MIGENGAIPELVLDQGVQDVHFKLCMTLQIALFSCPPGRKTEYYCASRA